MHGDGDANAFDIEMFLELLFNGGAPCNTCIADDVMAGVSPPGGVPKRGVGNAACKTQAAT